MSSMYGTAMSFAFTAIAGLVLLSNFGWARHHAVAAALEEIERLETEDGRGPKSAAGKNVDAS